MGVQLGTRHSENALLGQAEPRWLAWFIPHEDERR